MTVGSLTQQEGHSRSLVGTKYEKGIGMLMRDNVRNRGGGWSDCWSNSAAHHRWHDDGRAPSSTPPLL